MFLSYLKKLVFKKITLAFIDLPHWTKQIWIKILSKDILRNNPDLYFWTLREQKLGMHEVQLCSRHDTPKCEKLSVENLLLRFNKNQISFWQTV